MEYNNIKLETVNCVATIRLNRPGALNALGPELLAEFSAAVVEVGKDETLKALVVRGLDPRRRLHPTAATAHRDARSNGALDIQAFKEKRQPEF